MGGFRKNPKRLVSESLVSTKMINKRMIARAVSKEKPWLNPQQAEIIVELMFETIARGVIRDGFCEIKHFGRFDLRDQVIPTCIDTMPSLSGMSQSERASVMKKHRAFIRAKRPHFQPDYRLKAHVNGVTPDILGQAQYRPKDWRARLKAGLQRIREKYPGD